MVKSIHPKHNRHLLFFCSRGQDTSHNDATELPRALRENNQHAAKTVANCGIRTREGAPFSIEVQLVMCLALLATELRGFKSHNPRPRPIIVAER